MTDTISPDSLVVLHYRLRLDDGTVVLDTFSGHPATLQLGQCELAPGLENLLLGLRLGSHCTFRLAPDKAFGPRRSEAIFTVADPRLSKQGATASKLVSFQLEDEPLRAQVRQLDHDTTEFDFNHPLAGHTVEFEVHIIGIV